MNEDAEGEMSYSLHSLYNPLYCSLDTVLHTDNLTFSVDYLLQSSTNSCVVNRGSSAENGGNVWVQQKWTWILWHLC